ncbi:MAG: Brp/Blh family beta-carotene 15,15'-dioxygenase [Methylophilaceae bacterium]|jgi:beta-carotene 15,15'-dioxygenase|nr:Brp/Blh family beta-carotene 15,15'-dioxygenase [Methylophilaceae bacterium]
MALLKNMLNKVIIHQQIFIIFSLFILIINFFSNIINSYTNYLIWIALFFVSTLGVSHGALDGKLIWRGINKNFQRIILFTLYLILVLLGWSLWVSYPSIGLSVLLIMSIFHFGNSDLKFLKLSDINIRLSWGFGMTFMPILFKREVVDSIFYNLIGINIPDFLMVIIYCILILSIIRIYFSLINNVINSKANVVWFRDKNVLLILELTSLVILSCFTHPFIWFAIYFCGLHGIRSLIDSNFNWKIDLKWLSLFTLPVLVFIGFTYGRYWNVNSYSLIFPVLGSLTIAHMSLPSLLKFIKR